MLPCGTHTRRYEDDVAVVRTRLQWGLLIAFLALLFTLPLWGPSYLVTQGIFIGIDLLAVIGLFLVTGLCGQISLGQAAFMMVGAYAQALLMGKVGLPFMVALPLSGIITGLVGAVVGLPSLRVKELYLVLATFAGHFLITFAVLRLPSLTGGVDGIASPEASLGGLVFDSDRKFYVLMMAVVVILTFAALNIARTRTGRALMAVRDNDIAAAVLGVNVAYYKLLAFALSAFYAGIAGALWANYIGWIVYEQFSLLRAILLVGMLIVGGTHSLLGAVLGTLAINFLDQVVTLGAPFVGQLFPMVSNTVIGAAGPIAFGLVIMVFLIFEPLGLAHRWQIVKSYYRLWPFSY